MRPHWTRGDLLRPDLDFRGVKKIAGNAAITRNPVALHNVGVLVLTYANAHFGSSIQNFERTASGTPPQVKRGFLAVPMGPGLGLEINPEFLRKNPVPGEAYWG